MPQGFENAITGRLNPNFAYGRAFQSLVPDNVDVIMEEDDIIVSPFNFEIDEWHDLSGEFPEMNFVRLCLMGSRGSSRTILMIV